MGQAYVPGHKHDLFLSYAHDEAEWTDAFRKHLDKAIKTRLGRAASWWQDSSDLRAGQIWRDEIEAAIQDAVAFLAVCSPIYLERPFCHQECETFRDHHGAAANPANLKDRLFKIIKTPSVDGSHDEFFGEVQYAKFFADTGNEFAPASPEFDHQIIQTAKWIAEVLQRKRNAKTAIYVAQSAADMADDRAALAKQLEVYGYNVTTEYSTMGGARLKNAIDKAEWCVFLLGAAYDPYAERQLRQAIDLAKPIACWIHPVHSKSAGTQQQDLVKLVHSIPTQHELFGHPSVRGVIEELRRLLDATSEPVAPQSGNVALLYDSDTDSQAGAHLRKIIADEKLIPVIPATPDLSSLMAACDGALVFRGAARDTWLDQNFPHVHCADMLYRNGRQPLKARTFYVSEPDRLAAKYSGVDIIPFQGEVKPEALKPFFDRMRGAQARSADAGR
ncbi:MAG: toll/interleukin-1 receptor domain-containing protein [Bryobacteraceae bacterium]